MPLKTTIGRVKSGFDVWCLYREVAAHMKPMGKYDAVKFNWCGLKGNPARYESHPARWSFDGLMKHFKTKNDVIGYYLANILEGETWPMGMGMHAYTLWHTRIERLSYQFRAEMVKLHEVCPVWSDLFAREDSDPSLLFSEFSSGRVCLETLVILNRVVGYSSWDSYKYSSNPLDPWPTLAEKIAKYQKILEPNIRLGTVTTVLSDLYNNTQQYKQNTQKYVV